MNWSYVLQTRGAGPAADGPRRARGAPSRARSGRSTVCSLGQPRGIALLTVVAGLGIQAAIHAWLALRRHPLVSEHRGTLTFVSALIGDGLILPAVNAALVAELRRSGDPAVPGLIARACALGGAITAIMHLLQGALGLVNWSMPRPFAWNWIGRYHALFMLVQTSFLAYAAFVLTQRWRRGYRALARPLVVLGGVVGFVALLAFDYRRDLHRGHDD